MRSMTFGGIGTILVLIFAALEGQQAAGQASHQVPQFEPDPLWSQALPNKWVTGQVGGLAVDSHDNLWVFHRPATIPDGERGASLNPPQSECCIPAPSVLEFDTNGKFLQAWGGPGQGYEWFTSEHGIFVDARDNVWLAGSGDKDDQILKFTTQGKFLAQFGHQGKSGGSSDTQNLGGPAPYNPDAPPVQQFRLPHNVALSRDGLVYVADRVNDRIQVFKRDGTFVREGFVAPRTLLAGSASGLAFSPDQRFLYVIDGANHHVWILLRETLQVVDHIGQQGIFGGSLNVPHALALADRAYVMETGAITLSGPSAALREDHTVRDRYLGYASV